MVRNTDLPSTMSSRQSQNRDFPLVNVRPLHNTGYAKPARRLLRGGHALLVGILAFTGVGVASVYMTTVMQTPPSAETGPMSSHELRTMLVRAQLLPDSLAAAGVEPSQVGVLITAARSELDEQLQTLRRVDALRQQHQSAVTMYRQLVGAENPTPQDRQLLAQAETDLKTATQQAESVISAIRAAAEATLTTDQVQALAAIRTNKGREVPIEYIVVERTDQEWVELREALANVRIAAKHGVAPAEEALARVARADADPTVTIARADLDSRTTAIQQAWDAAVAVVEE